MKTDGKDMEWLREQWHRVNIDMEGLHDDVVPENVMNSRVTGLRGTLLKRYTIMAVFCCVCPLWIFSSVRLGFPLWFNIAYGGFFVVMAVLLLIQRRVVAKLDVIGMSVSELLVTVYKVQIVRYRCKWIGCMLAVPLLVWLIILIYRLENDAMIIGAWGGAVIGAAIGLWLDLQMRRLLRDLRDAIGGE